EVNVKEIEFVDGAGMLVKKVKCNFRTMGKKFGKLMKDVNAAVTAMSQEQIAELEQAGSLNIVLGTGDTVLVEAADVEIYSEDIPGWTVANEGALTVALDITVTEELKTEGVARELVKRIQNLRKESGFEITDRIDVLLQHHSETDKAVAQFGEYISAQVLANSLTLTNVVDEATELDFEDYKVSINIKKSV
ncbi:MAG: isoleucine--tRNA ligase, partial [Bacteroidaceae bacterium]|nr:isoleucine--tRNA ligase [Bacteroidaceae bacterium]